MVAKKSKKNHKTRTFTDEELVQLFLDTRENNFFEKLYERYSDKVYHKCLSFVRDSARAEDLTHDIFLKLIFKIGTFNNEAKFSTWLYSITYNHCIDHLRYGKRRGEVRSEHLMDIPDYLDLGNLFNEKDYEARQLNAALNRLSIDERGILYMKYLNDLSIRDIAGIFSITESAAKMRLVRSKEKLKKGYLESMIFTELFLFKLFEIVKDMLSFS